MSLLDIIDTDTKHIVLEDSLIELATVIEIKVHYVHLYLKIFFRSDYVETYFFGTRQELNEAVRLFNA